MYIVHGVEYGKYTRLSNEIDELLLMDSTFSLNNYCKAHIIYTFYAIVVEVANN